MDHTKSKLEIFYITLEQLIASVAIKRGKDFRLVEKANKKVLYLHIESIYHHYRAAVKEQECLSIAFLRTYLENSHAFIKYKPIQFEWNERMNETVSRKHVANACSVMLCYDIIRSKYGIDFEKYRLEEFETALLKKKVEIDEIIQRGKFVNKAIGFILGQKHIWKADGSCYTKNGNPNPKYNLKF